jgi:hypothetical protein
MMPSLTIPRVLGVAGIVAMIALASCSQDYPVLSALAPTKTRFSAQLVGTNEVPSVTTTATGTMTLTQEDSVNLLFEITAAGIDSITMAHIHAGAAGSNGPIITWFFPTEASTAAGPGTRAGINGVVRVGRINRANRYVAPYTLDSLLARLRAGTAYINIHTRRNPGGEIRGQLTQATP